MNITPVRFRDRWIDDGSPVELWDEDRSIGVRLAVASTSEAEPNLAAMELRRITMDDDPGGYASLIVDLSSGEIRSQADLGGTLGPPFDLAWLRGRLDDELRAALRQRLDRKRRAFDLNDWLDGDRPRVALGERAMFAQLFPAAWDLVVRHRGTRYALIDSYRVAPDANSGSLGVEIVALGARAPIGTAEIDLAVARNPPTGRRRVPPWRSSRSVVDPVLHEFWDHADRWFELIGRADIVARTAVVMQTWDSDVRDPSVVVTALLGKPGGEDEMLQDRVKALGSRCIPALRTALDAPKEETSRYAARLLAALGDPSGLDRLVAALGDPGFDDPSGERPAIVDAIIALGVRALEPLLAALARTRDREAQDWLLDAVTAIDVHDDRLRDLLIELVRAEPGRAGRLADYGDRSPAVIAVLVELLEPRVNALRGNRDDDDDDGDAFDDDDDDGDAFDDASELAQALRDLDVHDGPVQQFGEIAKARREARMAATRASQPSVDPAPFEPTPSYAPPAPVHVTPRPGRNEPCWCGSNKKYKKCHLEADDEARAR